MLIINWELRKTRKVMYYGFKKYLGMKIAAAAPVACLSHPLDFSYQFWPGLAGVSGPITQPVAWLPVYTGHSSVAWSNITFTAQALGPVQYLTFLH